MNVQEWWRCSFAATIAYGWLAIACVVAASLVLGAGVVPALLSAGAAYVSQSFATNALGTHRLGVLAATASQFASAALWLAAVIAIARA